MAVIISHNFNNTYMSNFIDKVKELTMREVEPAVNMFLLRFADKLIDFPMPQSMRVSSPDDCEQEAFVAVWRTFDNNIVPLTIECDGCIFNCIHEYDNNEEGSLKFISDLQAIRTKLI
jgi:hypothetical protein